MQEAAGRSSGSLPERVLELLRRSGLAAADEAPRGIALSGGVSSEIWRVDLKSGPVCVKRALPRLRVPQLWEVPVERNRYEYEWLSVAGDAVPRAAPKVLAQQDGAFVMQFLDFPVWKNALRGGAADAGFAAQVGRTLAAIHAASARREELAARFPTDAIFHAIRLEPYLLAAAARHPELKGRLEFLVERTAATKLCLVHGDVSPKNILVAPHGPVFLDAECAWYGDPAFDLAFCLNHLLLKCLWVPRAADGFLRCFEALLIAYFERVSWEDKKALEERIASLLPGLLLARVDGKSPVEYVTEETQKQAVRRFAREFLLDPRTRLSQLISAWQRSST